MHMELGNNRPRLKILNQTAIRSIIYYHGPIMRSEIASKLSLTLPTITTNINNMILHGLIQEIAETSTTQKSLGRKANPVDIVADSRYFIGAQMLRDARSLCIIDYRGNIAYSDSNTTLYFDYDDNIQQISQMILKAIQVSKIPREKIAGIGISISGIVDTTEGKLISHHQNNWFDKDVRKDLSNLTHYNGSISVENNACARAIAAQLFNREILNDVPSYAYLFISRGISCPLVLNNSNLTVSPIGPGELGYMIMDCSKSKDPYGNTGTLNSLAGERSIIERCTEAMQNGNAPILERICEGNTKPTIPQILKAQEEGEKIICDIISSSIYYLGIAISNIDNFVHPHTILIESQLFHNEQNRTQFLDTVRENFVRPESNTSHFIFLNEDAFIGARSAAAVAIKTDLETYIES